VIWTLDQSALTEGHEIVAFLRSCSNPANPTSYQLISEFVSLGILLLIMSFVVSYGYPGSDKRKCNRKVSASGHGRGTTYITIGDSVRSKF